MGMGMGLLAVSWSVPPAPPNSPCPSIHPWKHGIEPEAGSWKGTFVSCVGDLGMDGTRLQSLYTTLDLSRTSLYLNTWILVVIVEGASHRGTPDDGIS